MLLPVLLAFGVIGWEQVLHSTPGASRLPLYQVYEVFHWLSDGLLALPLAVAAEWIGQRLANRQHLGRRSLGDLVGRAALICLAFAALLVPGAAVHEGVDALTHAHQAVAFIAMCLSRVPIRSAWPASSGSPSTRSAMAWSARWSGCRWPYSPCCCVPAAARRGCPTPGFGPPKAYNTPNSDNAVGGNPAVRPYLQGGPSLPDANEAGWKDTIKMYPGTVTRLIARWAPEETAISGAKAGTNPFSFDPTRADSPGYVWHCHILDHEDNEMMRPLRLSNRPNGCGPARGANARRPR